MRIQRQKLPTFSQWKTAAQLSYRKDKFPLIFEVLSGWINDEWRTITFETEEFRLSEKFSRDAYAETADELISYRNQLVTASVKIDSDFSYEIMIDPAGDACENPKKVYLNEDIGRFELETPPLTPKLPKAMKVHPKH